MTNEQAIRILEEFKVIDDWTIVHLPPMEDAVDKAIEALRDVINCVKCEHYTERETATGINGECKMDTAHRGDLISRQDALDALGEEPPVWYEGEDEIAERNQWRRDKAAIESLPSAETSTNTSTNTSTDLIRRQAAIECCSCLHPEDCWAEIKALPSAEPKTGKWIKSHVEDLGLITTYICSECRMQSSSTYNFCPNCGARMNGGEEE